MLLYSFGQDKPTCTKTRVTNNSFENKCMNRQVVSELRVRYMRSLSDPSGFFSFNFVRRMSKQRLAEIHRFSTEREDNYDLSTVTPNNERQVSVF